MGVTNITIGLAGCWTSAFSAAYLSLFYFDHSQATEDYDALWIPELRGVHMPESIEERLKRIEAYLELLKEFGFDEPSKGEDEASAV